MLKTSKILGVAVGLLGFLFLVPAAVFAETEEIGSNYVSVFSCEQVGHDIKIISEARGNSVVLTSSCRDAGHGLRDYAMTCVSRNQYLVSWKPCGKQCAETDQGKDKYNKGKNIINYANGAEYTSGEDYCKDENTVTEFTCSAGGWNVTYEDCGRDYKCQAGACVAKTAIDVSTGTNNAANNSADSASGNVTYSCLETDGGLNYNEKGSVRGKDEITLKYDVYYDSCGASVGDQGKTSGDYVAEKVCVGASDNPYVMTQWQKCKYGCNGGICKEEPVFMGDLGDLTLLSLAEIKALEPMVINFEDTAINTASGYWEKYKVKFTADKGKIIYVNDYNRGGKTSSGQWSISNNAVSPNTSNNDALKITFKEGVTAVGFYLGNGNGYGWQVDTYIKVYGANNKLLGIVSKHDVPNEVTAFVGFKAEEKIYLVTIDYGDVTLSEELDDLMFYPAVAISSGNETAISNSGQGIAVGNKNAVCYNLSGKGYLAKGWSDPKVWYVDGNNKHWFTSEDAFFSWFSDFGTVKIVKQSILSGLIIGPNVCVKSADNGSNTAVSSSSGGSVDNDSSRQMSCGDSAGGDGLYSMCKGDTLYYEDKLKISNNGYTDKVLYIFAIGLEKQYYRLPFNQIISVNFSDSGVKYNLTYEQKSDKHGAFMRIEKVK